MAAEQPEQVRSLLLHVGWITTGPREALMFDLWSRLLAIDSSFHRWVLVSYTAASSCLGVRPRAGRLEVFAPYGLWLHGVVRK